MNYYIITQLLSGTLGSLGFAMVFGLKKKYFISVALGGLLCCTIYFSALHIFNDLFFSCLLASALGAFYSEIAARIKKAPSTLFFISSIIPLIPGGNLYYACSNAVIKNWDKARNYAMLTVQYALAIAAGACIVWAFMLTVEKIKRLKSKI